MSKTVDLKRCPFCGAKAKARVVKGDGLTLGMVECSNCGGAQRCIEDTCRGAVVIWNDRRGEKIAELKFLKDFCREADLSAEICRDQLRSLWTAYCFHHNLIADTLDYDMGLTELWGIIEKSEPDTGDWGNDEEFDNFMCAYLV